MNKYIEKNRWYEAESLLVDRADISHSAHEHGLGFHLFLTAVGSFMRSRLRHIRLRFFVHHLKD